MNPVTVQKQVPVTELVQSVQNATGLVKTGLVTLFVAVQEGFAKGDLDALVAVREILETLFGNDAKGTMIRKCFDDACKANTNKALAGIVAIRGTTEKSATPESKLAAFTVGL